jgi:hypothetical protein
MRLTGEPPADQFPAEPAADARRALEQVLARGRAFFTADEQAAFYRVQRALADAAREAGAL